MPTDFNGNKSLTPEQQDTTALLAHQLFEATDPQIDAWIDANVTNLAEALVVLKLYGKILKRMGKAIRAQIIDKT